MHAEHNRIFGAAIVIVTHNRADSLRVLLDDIAACTLPPSLQEIVVVENGNGDSRSARMCAAWKSSIRLIYASQDDPRKATALNFAISIATAPFIVFFDDDVRIDPDTIASFIAAAARHGPGHHFGGRVLARIEKAAPSWLSPLLPYSAKGFSLGEEERALERPQFLGCNWAAFRVDLLAAGGFPQYLGPGVPYPAGGDESIMQARLLNHGSTGIYVPNAVVSHHVPYGSNDLKFARDRSRSYGLRLTLAEFVEANKRAPYWPPRWMVRKFVELWVSCAVGRLMGKECVRRAEREIELAKTMGSLEGFRVLRKYPQIMENRPIVRDIVTQFSASGATKQSECEDS